MPRHCRENDAAYAVRLRIAHARSASCSTEGSDHTGRWTGRQRFHGRGRPQAEPLNDPLGDLVGRQSVLSIRSNRATGELVARVQTVRRVELEQRRGLDGVALRLLGGEPDAVRSGGAARPGLPRARRVDIRAARAKDPRDALDVARSDSSRRPTY